MRLYSICLSLSNLLHGIILSDIYMLLQIVGDFLVFFFLWLYMCMCLCIYKCKQQHFYLFFHWWVFRLFLCLDYCNSAALDIEMKISFLISVFISFGHILKSRITGSHGSSIFNFFEEPPYCFL